MHRIDGVHKAAFSPQAQSHVGSAGMPKRRIQTKVMVRNTDPLVREHRLGEIHILPGVSMLDIVYKTLASAGCTAEAFLLRKILFQEPVVTNEGTDRRLTVTIELATGTGKVRISSLPWKGSEALSQNATMHMTCDLAPMKGQPSPALLTFGTDDGEDLEVCYQITRGVGIYHDSFMKCMGHVTQLPSGDILGRVSLGTRAAARTHDFLLHPVLLDCSTIVPLYRLRNHFEDVTLFIPFAIEEFWGLPLTGTREVLIRVEPANTEIAERQILEHSFGLYDIEGAPLAYFKNFAVKRVRSLEHMRLLIEGGISAPAIGQPVRTPVPVVATPTVRNEDPLVALISTLIGQHADILLARSDFGRAFFDLGLDSLALLEISESLEKSLGVQLYPTLLFEHSNVDMLADYLRKNFANETAFLSRSAATHHIQPTQMPYVSAPSLVSPNPAPAVLVPLWRPVEFNEATAASAARVAVVGLNSQNSLGSRLVEILGPRVVYPQGMSPDGTNIENFREALAAGLDFDEIWLADADHELAFSLVKLLLKAGRLQSALTLRALTLNAFSVFGEVPDEAAGHGIWGLWQTLSRECQHVRVCVLDLGETDAARLLDYAQCPWLADFQRMDIAERQLLAVREGRFYERKLYRTERAAGDQMVEDQSGAFVSGGAYLIIGGAGGVGMALLRHLRQRYGAYVAVMGRRGPENISSELSDEGEYGKDVLYIQGSVESQDDLVRAFEQVRNRFGKINGIIHSAMVLNDQRLAEMEVEDFAQVLAPKVTGARMLAKATEDLQLDFILFFSSVQSFIGNVSQGNYAAASTYLDGFAAALRGHRRYPIFTVNWGFWGEVGAVATSVHRHLLARQGMYGLCALQAFEAMEGALATGWDQVAIVSADEHVLREFGLSPEFALERRRGAPHDLHRLGTTMPSELPPMFLRQLTDLECSFKLMMSLVRKRVRFILRELASIDCSSSEHVGCISREHEWLIRVARKILDSHGDEQGLGLAGETFENALTELVETRSELVDFAPLMRVCLAAYPDIIAGRRSALEVMFPEGSVEFVEPVYGRNAISAYYNDLVARAVVAFARQQDRRPLRVLEIGAGTGSTARAVVDWLRKETIDCEYCYTDLWDTLVADARRRLSAEYPEMRFRFLDINSDPTSQGLETQFDIVIATNVLHASRELRLSLRYIKRLVRFGGALVLNESVEVQEYSTFIFGLLPGWRGASDPELRLDDSPLASRETWSRLLHEEGFVAVERLVPENVIPLLAMQEVFVALSNGEVRVSRERLRGPPAFLETAKGFPAFLRNRVKLIGFADLGVEDVGALRWVRLCTDERGHLWLLLDNAPANTYSKDFLEELCTVLEHLQSRPALLRGRILYLGHCGPYFSLGGDRAQIVHLLKTGQRRELRAFAENVRRLLTALASIDTIVIAVVDGTAQGGGLETILAADMQVVRDGVKVGLPEIKSGLIPGMGGLTLLQNRIGTARVKRLVLCGELISAREAFEMGVISHVEEDPYAAAFALAERMSHLETAAYMKRLLARDTARQLTADIDSWLEYIQDHQQWINVKRIMGSQSIVDAVVQH
jgi:enoyl-CoA hydratase/carnithine racemase/NAD(P)-dependent dehydrogenase (short-subunit alcohol dehydrogenase family)/SAM-dependent methyltransferase